MGIMMLPARFVTPHFPFDSMKIRLLRIGDTESYWHGTIILPESLTMTPHFPFF